MNWSSSGSFEVSLEPTEDLCRASNSCLAAAIRATTSGGAPIYKLNRERESVRKIRVIIYTINIYKIK